MGTITLAHEGSWEQMISFTPAGVGEDQKVEFMLFKIGEVEACEILNLWIDVVAAE